MNKITNHIYIGSTSDANKKDILLENDFDAVINVAREQNLIWPHLCDPADIDIEYHKVGLDMADNINLPSQWLSCVNVIDQMINRNRKILVHCHAGAQRAPAVVSLWISINMEWSLTEAFDFVKQHREQTDPWPQHLEETNAALMMYKKSKQRIKIFK